MKRDMDIIRDLLLWMEEQNRGLFFYGELPEMPTMDNTIEQIQILHSGGFLTKTPNGAFRVSWEGHEFLDKVRDPEIWKKTKKGASKLGSWSVKLLGELATGYIKLKATELGLPI